MAGVASVSGWWPRRCCRDRSCRHRSGRHHSPRWLGSASCVGGGDDRVLLGLTALDGRSCTAGCPSLAFGILAGFLAGILLIGRALVCAGGTGDDPAAVVLKICWNEEDASVPLTELASLACGLWKTPPPDAILDEAIAATNDPVADTGPPKARLGPEIAPAFSCVFGARRTVSEKEKSGHELPSGQTLPPL